MRLYLDIETIPTQRDDVIERLRAEAQYAAENDSPPGNYKKPESIARWREERIASAHDDAIAEHERTALEGGYGEIVCVCWALDAEPIESLSRRTHSEAAIVDALWKKWELLDNSVNRHRWSFCGYNVQWDLKFLHHRAVVYQLRPSVALPYDDPPWRGSYVDIMQQWSPLKGFGKLTQVADMLGCPVPDDDAPGSEIWRLYQAGDWDAIELHCRRDVERVRWIDKKLRFEG